jgi:quercetin dioxygenase-like cupin family protein
MKPLHEIALRSAFATAGSLAVAIAFAAPLFGQEPEASSVDLFHQPLEVWTEGEVIVTRFDLPAGFDLPRHTHPGEEVVYILEGSATAVVEDEPDTVVEAGEAYWIPYGRVHTAVPGPDGVKGLVFRVHREGEPIRTDVE